MYQKPAPLHPMYPGSDAAVSCEAVGAWSVCGAHTVESLLGFGAEKGRCRVS